MVQHERERDTERERMCEGDEEVNINVPVDRRPFLCYNCIHSHNHQAPPVLEVSN